METDVRVPLRPCVGCGADIPAPRGKIAKYCTDSCRTRMWARKERIVHPERILERGRQNYERNREKILADNRKRRSTDEARARNGTKHREWCQNNPEKCREYNRKKYWRDPAKSIAAAIAWVKKNPEKRKAYWAKHYAENATAYKLRAKDVQRKIRRATPAWLSNRDRNAIDDVYRRAIDATGRTGIRHQVDHIVPLQGKHVCGLHVPWNLRVLPWRTNRRKSNKFSDDSPIQLSLLAA